MDVNAKYDPDSEWRGDEYERDDNAPFITRTGLLLILLSWVVLLGIGWVAWKVLVAAVNFIFWNIIACG